jgi:hypothetical protein
VSAELTPEILRRAAANLLLKVEQARQHPRDFFELAAREEHTRARVQCAAHQRVLFDFAAAHRRSVIRVFAGGTKTYSLAYYGLHCLGNDRTGRGAIIGATAGSAAKVLTVIRDAIEDPKNEQPEVHLVFPSLAPSPLISDPWGQNRITVDRPAGIRDPSFIAVGVNSDLPGSRLKWILCDDILDEENTATRESRDKLKRNFGRKVLTRLDVRDAWIVIANTPWEYDDLTFDLERAGWPTLSMEVEGEVRFTSDVGWTSEELRQSRLVPGAWRLAEHDSEAFGAPLCEILSDGAMRKLAPGEDPRGPMLRFDLDEEVPLWPGTPEEPKFDRAKIAELRSDFKAMPGEFMAKYKLRPRAPLDEAKKKRLIEECKLNGMALGHRSLATSYRGSNVTFTGIDVAVSEQDGADLRSIFTFEQIPELNFFLVDGRPRRLRNARKILNVQFGLWTMAEFVDRIEREAKLFGSLMRVETNGAQDILRQWLVNRDASVPLEAHTTGEANKHHRQHGVAGVLLELENLAWIIPCDEEGRCPEAVEQWIAELLDYRPDRHPGDVLIGSWLAREQARSVFGDAAIPYDLASVAERFR